MEESKNSVCKFCGQEKKLIGAHIIPKHFYLNYKNEDYKLLDPFNCKCNAQQSGAKDKTILCSDCDNKIIGKFDDEGYKVLLQKIPQNLVYQDFYQKIYALKPEEYDYENLRKFFISILWRASISQLKEFKEINLGPYEDKALEILKDEKIYDKLFKILILKEPQNDDTNFLLTIIQKKIGSYYLYNIVMAGYSILIFHNEQNIPLKLRNFYKDYFLSEKNLKVIEDPLIAEYKRKGFINTLNKMFNDGFIPRKPKNKDIT